MVDQVGDGREILYGIFPPLECVAAAPLDKAALVGGSGSGTPGIVSDGHRMMGKFN